MNLVEVIPLARFPKGAPDTLSYFTSQVVLPGSFVVISIQKRSVVGIAAHVSPLSNVKALIRKQDFQVKKIETVYQGPILPKITLKLFAWAAKFFLTSQSRILKTALPNYFAKPSKALKDFLATSRISESLLERKPALEASPIFLLEGTSEERFLRYEKEISRKLTEHETNQVLVLFPTILEAEAFMKCLQKNIRSPLVFFGSHQTEREAAESWKKCVSGEARVLVGTRNAVFIPLPNLSLVIIDTEGSPYYKAWDGEPKFDARDIAERISAVFGAPLLYGGSFFREETYQRTHYDPNIKHEQLGAEKKVSAQIVSLKKYFQDNKQNFNPISSELQEALAGALAQNQKAFLFLGRRGHSANIVCSSCGYVAFCKRCDAPLVVHLGKDVLSSRFLLCHKCFAREAPMNVCPECGGHTIQAFGLGTQKIEEEIKKLFPKARIMRLDSDASDDPKELRSIIRALKPEDFDILIGTEIALKPSLFYGFSVSAIISLDQLLRQPNFRQEEHIFFIVQQLRDMTENKIIIQTGLGSNAFLTDLGSGNSESFYTRDSIFRKQFSYPPFAELIKLTIRNHLRLEAEKKALFVKTLLQEEFGKAGVQKENLYLIGPLPAFIPREKNEFIYHIILKIRDQNEVIKQKLLEVLPPYVFADVNPRAVL